jgi:hypothetical protein
MLHSSWIAPSRLATESAPTSTNESCSSLESITSTESKGRWPICQTVNNCTLLILGAVAFVSRPSPGARHDFVIFQESVPTYREFLLKKPGEQIFGDPVAGQTSWALLADKGYAGADALLRAITPKKALPNRRLSVEDAISNQKLSSIRVICENFYGRLKGLFAICAEKYRGKYAL